MQPKVVVTENVKGLLLAGAQKYVAEILKQFDEAGYYVDYKLLDASKMGVPQRRERVFFTAIRKDIYKGEFTDLFGVRPRLDLLFKEPEIVFKEIYKNYTDRPVIGQALVILKEARQGEPNLMEACRRLTGKQNFFGYKLIYMDKTPLTVLSSDNNIVFKDSRYRNFDELCSCGSYPIDYEFSGNKSEYLIGMSVPPVMTAQIATRIYEQWLK